MAETANPRGALDIEALHAYMYVLGKKFNLYSFNS